MKGKMMEQAIEARHHARAYISRLQNDPRVRQIFDGMTYQAAMEAEQRFPDPRDVRERTFHAAQRAAQLMASFVMDNDSELQAVLEHRDKLLEGAMTIARNTASPHIVMPVSDKDDNEATN